jgi:class 3 adenylate cyclase
MGTESTSLRTFVGSVVCIDLVGYSKLPVDQQIEVKKRFNARLMKALARVPTHDRVMLDTGDGVLIGFLSDPEQCFATALHIREAIDPGSARIGIHLGSVKLLPGLSGEVRLVGDTANIAERIASLADPGQIVVSRSFHAMVSRLSDKHEALFHPAQARADKQGQEHEIYVVDAPTARRARCRSRWASARRWRWSRSERAPGCWRERVPCRRNNRSLSRRRRKLRRRFRRGRSPRPPRSRSPRRRPPRREGHPRRGSSRRHLARRCACVPSRRRSRRRRASSTAASSCSRHSGAARSTRRRPWAPARRACSRP